MIHPINIEASLLEMFERKHYDILIDGGGGPAKVRVFGLALKMNPLLAIRKVAVNMTMDAYRIDHIPSGLAVKVHEFYDCDFATAIAGIVLMGRLEWSGPFDQILPKNAPIIKQLQDWMRAQ